MDACYRCTSKWSGLVAPATPGVVTPLVIGVAAGVLVPVAVCVQAAGGSWRTFAFIALVVAVAAAVLMVGILGLG